MGMSRVSLHPLVDLDDLSPMRLKNIAYVLLMATALAGCNDTIDSAVDLSKVKNKVEQPLPDRIVTEMQKRNMPRNSPIMIRVFKEEGVMEIWKAKADNRFDKIAQYQICAWSGKLGPKVKEGDRQAPEGFYNLTPAHLNPNSKYYLAINTGFPNRYDAANGRTGSNLMIHGACSSSGCYSMTDEQILEIYAFARDAFKGGQSSVQLQAFPFRMTAENMARHRTSEHLEFWKMLKVGYDNFEVTKRPPEVNVCERKYVFNQQLQGSGSFQAGAACPPMSTPPALMASLNAYEKEYQMSYAKALDKLDGKLWYEPTEAERKAVVAAKRKGRDLAYAPTGTSLEAGKLVKPQEFEALMAARMSKTKPVAGTTLASAAPAPSSSSAVKQNRVTPVEGAAPGPRSAMSVQTAMAQTAAAPASNGQQQVAATTTGSVPVPAPNPLAYAAVQQPQGDDSKKPFWKFW
jgi:murein L,D-transpeptidase YafK